MLLVLVILMIYRAAPSVYKRVQSRFSHSASEPAAPELVGPVLDLNQVQVLPLPQALSSVFTPHALEVNDRLELHIYDVPSHPPRLISPKSTGKKVCKF